MTSLGLTSQAVGYDITVLHGGCGAELYQHVIKIYILSNFKHYNNLNHSGRVIQNKSVLVISFNRGLIYIISL